MDTYKTTRQRDNHIDVLRGFAAFIVIVGHVLQKFDGFTDSIFTNLIFSIQMPLFMCLSGYSRGFSPSINSASRLKKHLSKKVSKLLVPWAAWSLASCVFLERMSLVEYLHKAAFKMEIAFWFLFSLFTIELIFTVAEFLSYVISKKQESWLRKIVFVILYGIGIGALLVVGAVMGITFLGIKYSVYYSVFYFIGYIAYYLNESGNLDKHPRFRESALFVSIVVYAVLLSKFNVITMPDFSLLVAVRVVISILGCWIAFELVYKVPVLEECKIWSVMKKAGTRSLELYVVHFFVVRLLDTSDLNILTISGMYYAVFYVVFVVSLTYAIIWVLNQSRILRRVLFGKA